MCGLCGVALVDPRHSPAADDVGRMADTLAHRGPDDRGVHVDGPFGLGFRRLSIIDVGGGHQPLFNEAGDVALVINCEIYNWRELRAELERKGHVFRTHADSEVVLHLYEEHGERCAERLTGMYAFAIADLRDRARPKLLLGRDRLGIKPLYWSLRPEGLIFASEPKALLAWGGGAPLERELRPEALLDYLVAGYVGGERSAWAPISRLPPAHTLAWSPGAEPRLRRYWDLPLVGLRGPTDDEEVLGWLDRVVREHLESEVPLGAFLSGGIDSNAVVDSMQRARGAGVVACSVGFEEKSHDELDLARAAAARLGLVHHTQVLRADPAAVLERLPWIYDEPLADPSTVPTYLVSRMAREHVTVALSGDGGDETFAGYRRYAHDLAENRLRRLLRPRGAQLAGALGARYPRLDGAPRFLRGKTFLSNLARDPAAAYWASVTQLDRGEALALLAPDVRARLAAHDPCDAFRTHYEKPQVDDPLYRAQYADMHTYLPDQILAKVDRASMGNSLEVRVPLLDHRFVELFAPLPASEKVRGARGKHAFRRALRARLPGAVLDGRKRGFDTPLAAWIRGPLAGAVAEAVETLPADWFDRNALRARLAEHAGGGRDHGRLLWSLLVLEHWRRAHAVRGLSA
jgi:asparagine synthase (glutamine-hydrolysing)